MGGSCQEAHQDGRVLSGACQDDQDDQENQNPVRTIRTVRRPPGSWHPNKMLMLGINMKKIAGDLSSTPGRHAIKAPLKYVENVLS